MNDKLLQAYKEIKDKIAELEANKATLELTLFDAFDEMGKNSIELDGYQFVRMGRKSYEYPESIASLSKELSKQKKLAEIEGTATLKKETQFIRVVSIRENNES